MFAKGVRSKTWPTLCADSTLEEASRQMGELNRRVLPVWEGGVEVGAIGEFDIALATVVERRDPALTLVRDVMPAGPACCLECHVTSESYQTVGG